MTLPGYAGALAQHMESVSSRTAAEGARVSRINIGERRSMGDKIIMGSLDIIIQQVKRKQRQLWVIMAEPRKKGSLRVKEINY